MGFRALCCMALLAASLVAAGQDEGVGPCDPDGIQSSGARYRICMPPDTPYNGDLVIYCHGYIEPGGPPEINENQFCFGGLCVYDIFHSMGYAFAATSYATHGLAVREGMADVIELVDIFAEFYGMPNRVYLVGFSEGAQIAMLVAEQRPDLINGVVAACGPIGDWRMQINYLGDFRIIFDAVFPGLMPGNPTEISPELIENWDTYWETVVRPELLRFKNRYKVVQLLRIANVPARPFDYLTTVNYGIHDLLWYNVVGTNDVIEKLGGQPYDNTQRVYAGGPLGPVVEEVVPRFSADADALEEIATYYETTGQLDVPSVIMHTLADYNVPYWHVPRYQLKLVQHDAADMATFIPIVAYGHCTFSPLEITGGFAILVRRVTGAFPTGLGNLNLTGDDSKLLGTMLDKFKDQHLLRQE